MSPSHWLRSIGIRLFLVLSAGMFATAGLAGAVSFYVRQVELHQLEENESADILANFLATYQTATPLMRSELLLHGLPRVRPLLDKPKTLTPAPELDAMIHSRIGPRAGVVQAADIGTCYFVKTNYSLRPKPSGCWIVPITLADGKTINVRLGARSENVLTWRHFGLALSTVFTIGILALAFSAAWLTAAPLNRLARDARFRNHLSEPLPVSPNASWEIQQISEAINGMTARLQGYFRERTHILASISHDLQTPLTRMRLRIDSLQDPKLKKALLNDIMHMRSMIAYGLDMAELSDLTEPETTVQIDSLLETIASDYASAGHDVACLSNTGAFARVKILCLQRCLTNMVDNGLKYGERVEISAHVGGGSLEIIVRDFGPGISESELERVFQPFVRLEQSRSKDTGGTGLGLAIARMLAEKFGARVELENALPNGLIARVYGIVVTSVQTLELTHG